MNYEYCLSCFECRKVENFRILRIQFSIMKEEKQLSGNKSVMSIIPALYTWHLPS